MHTNNNNDKVLTINYYYIIFIFYNKTTVKQPIRIHQKLAMAQLRHLKIRIDATVERPSKGRRIEVESQL